MIGICTPYRHCETTVAALRLAELAVGCGLNVRLLGIGVIERGLHPYWDCRVRSAKDDGVYLWAKGRQQLVWFDCLPSYRSKADVVAEKAKHVLVLPHQHFPYESGPQLGSYRVVCPSRNAYQIALQLFYNRLEDHTRLTWCRWDSGLPTVPQAPSSQRNLRLYIHLDNSSILRTGLFFVRIAGELLRAFSGSQVTLDCDKAFEPDCREELHEICHYHEPRLRVRYRTPLLDQLQLLRDHDWTFEASRRLEFGMTILRSLSCGTPVLAYDLAPSSEILSSKRRNGLLLPIVPEPARLGIPTGIGGVGEACCCDVNYPLGYGETLDWLVTRLRNDLLLERCRQGNWQLESRRETFERFWREQWGVL